MRQPDLANFLIKKHPEEIALMFHWDLTQPDVGHSDLPKDVRKLFFHYEDFYFTIKSEIKKLQEIKKTDAAPQASLKNHSGVCK